MDGTHTRAVGTATIHHAAGLRRLRRFPSDNNTSVGLPLTTMKTTEPSARGYSRRCDREEPTPAWGVPRHSQGTPARGFTSRRRRFVLNASAGTWHPRHPSEAELSAGDTRDVGTIIRPARGLYSRLLRCCATCPMRARALNLATALMTPDASGVCSRHRLCPREGFTRDNVSYSGDGRGPRCIPGGRSDDAIDL
jgi:hypothetical protein